MKIELFLESINQEMIGLEKPKEITRTKPENALGVHKPGLCNGCIYASWTKDCCILDFSFKGRRREEIESVPDYWMIRRDVDGGLLWNPETGSVYLLDNEGYDVLNKLEAGLSEKEIARDTGYSLELLNNFIKDVLTLKTGK